MFKSLVGLLDNLDLVAELLNIAQGVAGECLGSSYAREYLCDFVDRIGRFNPIVVSDSDLAFHLISSPIYF